MAPHQTTARIDGELRRRKEPQGKARLFHLPLFVGFRHVRQKVALLFRAQRLRQVRPAMAVGIANPPAVIRNTLFLDGTAAFQILPKTFSIIPLRFSAAAA